MSAGSLDIHSRWGIYNTYGIVVTMRWLQPLCAQVVKKANNIWLASEMGWPEDQGTDCPTVLGTGEATSQMLG